MKHLKYAGWRGLGAAAAGLLMMGYGIYRNEVDVVMAKAVSICLECIGIG
ncbi:MAG: thioredoxin [Eubacterium sp.]|nr:thioredoxin [Eubacterium sp.]MCI8919964.1 thioredoxin [Eubacterium sp.]